MEFFVTVVAIVLTFSRICRRLNEGLLGCVKSMSFDRSKTVWK